MDSQISSYSLALFGSALIALIVAGLTWRRRAAPGALPLFLMLVTTVIWAGANGFLIESNTAQGRLFWFNVLSIGALCGTPALVAFALQYTGRGRWLTQRNLILICIVPAAGLLLTWTNDLHHLFYAQLDFTAIRPSGGKATPGIAYNIYLAYAYPLVLYTIVIITQAFLRSPRFYRGQAGMILIGTLIPFLGNIAYNIVTGGSSKGQLDPTPILFTVMGVFYAYGLFAFRLFDIVPVARHRLVEHMTDGVLVLDSQDRIVDINPAALRLVGLTNPSPIGISLDQLTFPFPERGIGQADVTLEGDPPRYFDVRAETLLDGQNQPNGRLIVLRDITEKKLSQASLERVSRRLVERENRFRRVFEISPMAIVMTSVEEGRIIDANDAFWKLSGHPPVASIGKTSLELRPGYSLDKRQEFINSLLEQKSIRDPYYVFVDDSDRTRHTAAFFELIDLDGAPAILSMFYDMTEQTEARSALMQSEERMRGLLNAIPETIFELRRDGTILHYLPSDKEAAPDISGEIVGKQIDQVMPAAIAKQIMFAIERALESGQLHVIEYQFPQNDRETTFEARVTVSGKDTVMLMAREISLQKWIEIERERIIEELEKRNAESESLRETTVIVTSTLDISETVQRILHQLKRVINYDSASVWLYTGTVAHLVGGIGIPEIPEADQNYEVAENEPDYPLWAQALPYILLDDIQETYPQFRQPPINYIRGWLGVPLKVHGRLIGIISLDSRTARYFTAEDAILTLNYANQVSIAVENARLFSDLQHELGERQKLIDALDAKNSELELFTYSVSHDLKSPLFTIRGFLSFLKEDIAAGNSARVEKDIQRINAAMDIMKQRLDDLLELSQAGQLSGERSVVPFNELAVEALELVHGRILDRDISVTVEANLASVCGDTHRLLEVIQNLIDNAAKFMGDQKHPLIEIGQHGEEHGWPVFFIRDNGMGIPPEHQARIFGVFNKLNPGVEGTGIGLSLVKRIIEAHGGRIWVESELNVGSTFYFSLPRG